MIEWLADHHVTVLHAAIHPGNESSNRVAEKLGLNRTDVIDDGEVMWSAELETQR